MRSSIALPLAALFALGCQALNIPTGAPSKRPVVSAAAAKTLVPAKKLLDAEKYDEAKPLIEAALVAPKVTAYDRAVSQRLLGFIASSRDDYPSAIAAYQKAIAENALANDEQTQTINQIAQLQCAEERWDDCLASYQSLLAGGTAADPQVEFSIANVYFRKADPANALHWVDRALAHSGPQAPSKYSLLRFALLYEQERYGEAADYLAEKLEAGAIESSGENLRRLGNAYMQADRDDRALGALERAAAESSDGDSDLMVARLLLDKEDYAAAIPRFRVALRKGNLKSGDGIAHLLLGAALYNQKEKDYAAAYREFVAAAGDPKVAKQAAEYIQRIPKKFRTED